ncbi:MAG TPA: potassium channel protein [Bryobacteraceae bacterium]
MSRRLINRAIFVGSLLLLTLVIGIIGFRLIENYSFFDAFYMTLITVTTVGYTEVHSLSRAGRIFNSFLIFFGVTVMFSAVGAMTQTIIELELQDPYGKRRRKRVVNHLRDHFIVCGFGRVGRNASLELQRAKVPFLVMDRNHERVERALKIGMTAVVADATRDESLREAGVMRARGLVAALPSDAENLFIILSAKTLNPKLNVVTRASEEEAGEKLRRAGADTVFAPYTIAGQRLAHALVRPHVVEFLDFTDNPVGSRVMMEQVPIAPGAEFDAKALRDMHLRRDLGVILLAVRKEDGRMLFNPPLETKVCAGDHLIVIGEQPNLQKLELILMGAG